jgi:hypothetical protein
MLPIFSMPVAPVSLLPTEPIGHEAESALLFLALGGPQPVSDLECLQLQVDPLSFGDLAQLAQLSCGRIPARPPHQDLVDPIQQISRRLRSSRRRSRTYCLRTKL